MPPRLLPLLAGIAACACAHVAPRQAASGDPASGRAPGARSAEPPPEGGQWVECYGAFSPTGDPKADLERLTRSCGPTGGMHSVTPIHLDRQAEQDPVDRYTFYVPKAGSCYRIYAVGDGSVGDLDLLLRGPDGADVVADVTHDAHPVLPPKGPICFDSPGLYLLEVSVFRGAGRYAIQVWGT